MTDEPRFEHDSPASFGDPFSDPEAAIGGPIEDLVGEGVEESWQDDDHYDFEDLSDTEAALENERELLAEAQGETIASEEKSFVHTWAEDISLLAAHRAMGELFDGVLFAVMHTRGLRSAGLPEDVQTVQLDLNRMSGPLVTGGLILLGLYFPELRAEIKAVLDSIPSPIATEEEKRLVSEAHDELNRRAAEELEQTLRSAGIHVVGDEDLQRLQEENDDADGSFGGLSMN